MDATEAAKALVEWATATCADLNSVYDHDPARLAAALPVATAAVSDEEVVASDPTLGIEVATFGLEQAALHVLRSTIQFYVTDTPPDTASEQLEGFVADLAAALKADNTLGGRVTIASPYWRASYEPPFVEFDDGTVARTAYFSLAIAELT